MIDDQVSVSLGQLTSYSEGRNFFHFLSLIDVQVSASRFCPSSMDDVVIVQFVSD